MAHSKEAHGKVAAMPQFNEGHWEKKLQDVTLSDGRYSSEMNQAEEYKKAVDGFAHYAKKHKENH